MKQQQQWNAYSSGGMRWVGAAAWHGHANHHQYRTLILDMYNPSTKTLIWQGNRHQIVNPATARKKIQKNLDNAMKKLLKDFPPKAK